MLQEKSCSSDEFLHAGSTSKRQQPLLIEAIQILKTHFLNLLGGRYTWPSASGLLSTDSLVGRLRPSVHKV